LGLAFGFGAKRRRQKNEAIKMSKTSTPALPKVVEDCHQCLLWIIPKLDHFPRARRFTLGERLENGLLEVLELLTQAAYLKNNKIQLNQANIRLATVRHLWRLSYELRAISIKAYDHGSKLLLELGKQVGGWLRTPR